MKDSTPDEIAAVVGTLHIYFLNSFLLSVFVNDDVIWLFAAPAFDYLEKTLGKYSSEGPFFLGNLGIVSQYTKLENNDP